MSNAEREMQPELLQAGSGVEGARGFGSDNWAGVHPRIMDALVEANVGHTRPYGYDSFSEEACKLASQHFGAPSTSYLVLNGVGSNNFSLALLLPRHAGIICATTAHIVTDEAGATEANLGAKLMMLHTPDGKLTPELIAKKLTDRGNEHHVEPAAVSISNLTELGTSYTPEETRAICDFAHENGLLVHVDGARISNAAAEQSVSIAALSGEAGVDVLGIGGTKNGMMYGEAVVVSERVSTKLALPLRKQMLQLASKGRFIGAQFVEMYGSDLYLECARQANECCAYLEGALTELGFPAVYQRGGNQLFVSFAKGEALDQLSEIFGVAPMSTNPQDKKALCRLVCAWDTTMGDCDVLIEAVAAHADELA